MRSRCAFVFAASHVLLLACSATGSREPAAVAGAGGASGSSASSGAAGATGSTPATGGAAGEGSPGAPRSSSAGADAGVDAGMAPNVAPPDCTAIDCPSCDPGELPVMLPGECCPSECMPKDDVDPASELDPGSCSPALLPACDSNLWPYCTLDWATAESWYMGCPNPIDGVYRARCGALDALVVNVPFGTRRFFYDAFGRLVGFESVLDGKEAHCEAYDAAFTVPDAPCIPVDDPCPELPPKPLPEVDYEAIGASELVTWDEAIPDCAEGQAAYDAFFASQLAAFNTCANDTACNTGGISGPANPCVQPCGVVLSVNAINSQILARLDQLGFVVCAACQDGPPPACTPSFGGRCASGHCSP